MNAERLPLWPLWSIFFGILFLLGARCFFGTDDIDEAFNVAVALQIESGQSLFNEIRTPYQIGNITQSLVISAFKKATGGSTEGLVLTLRISRLLLSALLALAAYHILKTHFRPVCALSASMLLLFCEGYAGSHFPVMAQDYFSLYFLLLSTLLLFGAVTSASRSIRQWFLFYGGGISTALLVWHYPTALPVALYFCTVLPVVLWKSEKTGRAIVPALGFVIGGITVICLAAITILPNLGIDGIKTFIEVQASSNLLKRKIFNPATIVSSITKVSMALVAITLIGGTCFVILHRTLRSYNIPISILWCGSSIAGSLALLAANQFGFLSFYPGTPLMVSALGVALPVLYFLPAENPTKRFGLIPISLIYIPSLLFSLCIVSVIYMGNVKPVVGFYSSGFFFLLFAFESLGNFQSEKPRSSRGTNRVTLVACLAAVSLATPLWLAHYNDVAPFKMSSRIGSGAYKWIHTNPERHQIVEQLGKDLRSLESSGRTILFSGRYRIGYLLSSHLPNTPSCFSACYWESKDGLTKTDPLYVGYPNDDSGNYLWREALDYFSKADLGLPDVMVLDPVEIKGNEISEFLERHYDMTLQRTSYTIYELRGI